MIILYCVYSWKFILKISEPCWKHAKNRLGQSIETSIEPFIDKKIGTLTLFMSVSLKLTSSSNTMHLKRSWVHRKKHGQLSRNFYFSQEIFLRSLDFGLKALLIMLIIYQLHYVCIMSEIPHLKFLLSCVWCF